MVIDSKEKWKRVKKTLKERFNEFKLSPIIKIRQRQFDGEQFRYYQVVFV